MQPDDGSVHLQADTDHIYRNHSDLFMIIYKDLELSVAGRIESHLPQFTLEGETFFTASLAWGIMTGNVNKQLVGKKELKYLNIKYTIL